MMKARFIYILLLIATVVSAQNETKLHPVQIDGAGASEGDVLTYEGGFWKAGSYTSDTYRFNPSSGILVTTKVNAAATKMYLIEILSNTYWGGKVSKTYVQGYYHPPSSTSLNTNATGFNPVANVYVFAHGGKLKVWWNRTGSAQTYAVRITDELGNSLIESVADSSLPTSRTNEKVIVSSQPLFTENDPTVGSHIKGIETTDINRWNDQAYKWVYNPSSGILVTTKVNAAASEMYLIEILSNTYWGGKVSKTYVQGYYHSSSGGSVNTNATGFNPVDSIYVFAHDGKLKFWWGRTGSAQTYAIRITDEFGNSLIETALDSALPASRTNEKVIVSSQPLFTENDPTVGSHIKGIETTDINRWNDQAYKWIYSASSGILATTKVNAAASEMYLIEILGNTYWGGKVSKTYVQGYYHPPSGGSINTNGTGFNPVGSIYVFAHGGKMKVWWNHSGSTRTYAVRITDKDGNSLIESVADSALPASRTNEKIIASSQPLYTESDPTVGSHIKSITTTQKTNWNNAFTWGNHATAGYLTGVSTANGLTGSGTATSPLSVNFTQGIVGGTGNTLQGLPDMKVKINNIYTPTLTQEAEGAKISFPDNSDFKILRSLDTDISVSGDTISVGSRNQHFFATTAYKTNLNSNTFYKRKLQQASIHGMTYMESDSTFTVIESGVYRLEIDIPQSIVPGQDRLDQLRLIRTLQAGDNIELNLQAVAPSFSSTIVHHATVGGTLNMIAGDKYYIDQKTVGSNLQNFTLTITKID